MPHAGQHTYAEITSQPDAWAQAVALSQPQGPALATLWAQRRSPTLLFTGCGSTYYLSLAAAALARERKLPANAAPGSEAWLLSSGVMLSPNETILVAVSRSGETSETLRAVDAFRTAGGKTVIVVTCYPDSRLARTADLLLAAPAGQEKSVAQTRSFAAMLVLCQMLIAGLSGDEGAAARLAHLPDAGRRLIADHGRLAGRLGAEQSLQRFFFLGNGPLYGLACEAMLKMKEMSLSYSEAYHVLELRHGPMSMVDGSALVVGLLSDASMTQERAVLADMRTLGGRTLAIAEQEPGGGEQVSLRSGLLPHERLVLYLPFLQLLAYERAIAKGLDPDNPANLTAVVKL